MSKPSPAALGRPVLCLVTGRSGSAEALVARAAGAARAGVDLIQLREPGLDGRRLLALTRDLAAAVLGTGARLVVNDRLDVALAGGAAGVHLRGDSYGAAEVRRLAPAGFLVGRSVHSEADAVRAEADGGCDYLIFGTVFESPGKPPGHPVAGLDALRRVCARVRLPVLAIGGMRVAAAAAVRDAGAAGIAGIGLFQEDRDVAETVNALRSAMAGGRREVR